MPKPGQQFNAITKIKPHIAIGCPCVCDWVEKDGYIIHAFCRDLSRCPGPDIARVFHANDFTFEAVSKALTQ